jgi:ribose/xylose/arabinose/galactoside ABC-type transport system permease subunit
MTTSVRIATLYSGLRARPLLRILQALGVLAAATFVLGAFTTPGFLSVENLHAILASTTFVGMTAVGMTVIMISGAFVSMSLGTTATIAAMCFIFTVKFGVVVALVLTILLGGLIGLAQGVMVGAWNANPIIVTIAAGAVQEGLSVAISGGQTLTPESDSYLFLNSTILGVPLGFYLLLALVLATEWGMRRTRFGREIYMLGENRSAARAAALPLGAIGARVFCFAGLAAAFAGVMLAAFNHSASLLLNRGTLNYDAIAATLIGGTAISGGRGSIWRTLVGVLVIACITDLVLLRGYSTGTQILVKGLIMMAYVLAIHLNSRDRKS